MLSDGVGMGGWVWEACRNTPRYFKRVSLPRNLVNITHVFVSPT